jgi:hypothetical protein
MILAVSLVLRVIFDALFQKLFHLIAAEFLLLHPTQIGPPICEWIPSTISLYSVLELPEKTKVQ